MKDDSPFDVVVIGQGISGLSVLYHLKALDVHRVALASEGAPSPTVGRGAGLLIGGQVDNFTRVSHAHGAEFAASLWRFGDAGFDLVMRYAESKNLKVARKRRLRLITSEPELVEARLAAEQLQGFGFSTRLLEGRAAAEAGVGQDVGARVIAVQDDGDRGAALEGVALLAHLARDVKAPRLGAVRQLTPAGNSMLVEFVDGSSVQAEIVVVAAHLGTKVLVPNLADALVSYADQWSEVRLAKGATVPELEGVVFSANQTYEWGVFTSDRTLRLGGGRYLRPMAGIEATTATAEPRITAHLLEQLAKTFPFAGGAEALTTTGFLDIRPCDELPVIGPMYGSGRILVAAGYMGSGLTMGFIAGKCIAELIKHGRSDTLPRRLWPERLRSLES